MQRDRREWDVQTLRSCFLPHDVDEVGCAEDTIAWYYEKTGILTARCAYKLALAIEQEEKMKGMVL
jgi:hypothetical protein